MRRVFLLLSLIALSTTPVLVSAVARAQGTTTSTTTSSASRSYAELVELFQRWRTFSLPPNTAVPDYRAAAVAARATALPGWQQRLAAISADGWTVQQVDDARLVHAEMNGMDFDLRVLRPWARDPAFYAVVWGQRTDVPLREGPQAVPEIALYQYRYPLSAADSADLAAKLRIVPALLAQAKVNLRDSNARDLWVYGTQELRNQAAVLAELQAGTLTISTIGRTQEHVGLQGASPELRGAVAEAKRATEDLVAWLDAAAPTKTGPSGVGRENYTWYAQNVHLVPYTWEEQVTLLRRELERSQASLALEQQHNRSLPQLLPAPNAAAFNAMAEQRVAKFLSFLVEQQIIPDKPYLKEVIRKQLLGTYPTGHRIFFTEMILREPMLLLSHDYHWIDLGRMRDEPNPSPIRRIASEANIWDTRAEGFATAFEELMLHAGLYDDNPRAKELVWDMLANRAARGLAALYVQDNAMTLEQAGQFHGKWTPGRYATAGDTLTAFEQALYLRQPGYGTSYIVGKVQLDQLMTEWREKQEQADQPFVLGDFLDRFNNDGMVPFALIERELIPEAALDHAVEKTDAMHP